MKNYWVILSVIISLSLSSISCASHINATLKRLPDGTVELKADASRPIELTIEDGQEKIKAKADTKGKSIFSDMIKPAAQIIEND